MPSKKKTYRPHWHKRESRPKTAQRLYGNRWRVAALAFLAKPSNRICRVCEADGVLRLATEVDHIKPHRGDYTTFWAVDNWQGLCKRHHSEKTRRGE
jgi:5-methylcytosine-specific restriction enzyme A